MNPPFTVASGYSYIYRRLPLTTTATSVFHTTPPLLGRSSLRVGESCSVSLEIKPPPPPSPFLPLQAFFFSFFRLGGNVCSLSFCKKKKKWEKKEKTFIVACIPGGCGGTKAALRLLHQCARAAVSDGWNAIMTAAAQAGHPR